MNGFHRGDDSNLPARNSYQGLALRVSLRVGVGRQIAKPVVMIRGLGHCAQTI